MYGQKNAKKRRFFSQCCDLFFGTSPCDGYEPEVKLQALKYSTKSENMYDGCLELIERIYRRHVVGLKRVISPAERKDCPKHIEKPSGRSCRNLQDSRNVVRRRD